MNICIVGLGSIGKRHLNNLIEFFNMKQEICNIDLLRHSKETDQEQTVKVRKVFYSPDDICLKYDIMFITNPTSFHFITIKKLQAKTEHMFIEKPLFDNLKYSLSEIRPIDTGNVYYVACPMRYLNAISYLKKNLEYEDIYSVRICCSSYLPEWRSNSDYRKIYSAKKELGGGVALDLIHEWDYVTYLFGIPLNVIGVTKKVSDLEIDSEDVALYIGTYEDKTVEIHLDYFGRDKKRTIELYCKKYTIYVDLIEQTIRYTGKINKLIVLDKNDMYKEELKYFFDIIQGKQANTNNLEYAYAVMKIALLEC